MNYIIHNAKCIQDQDERKRVIKTIQKQMTRLQKVGENYPKNIVVDLYFNEISDRQYMISAVVNLKGEIVFVKQKGENLDALVYALFDRMKLTLSKKINLERKAYLYQRKHRQFQEFLSNLEELQEMKRRKSREEFDRMIRVISRDVAIYIRRRLESAEMTTAVKRGKFKVQELMDDLYLELYDEIEQIPEQESAIKSWLYQKADTLLSEKFRELEFEKESFTQLDEIVENEYLMMDLYLINQMTAEEIAGVKQISVTEVEAVIREVNHELKRELTDLVSN